MSPFWRFERDDENCEINLQNDGSQPGNIIGKQTYNSIALVSVLSNKNFIDMEIFLEI